MTCRVSAANPRTTRLLKHQYWRSNCVFNPNRLASVACKAVRLNTCAFLALIHGMDLVATLQQIVATSFVLGPIAANFNRPSLLNSVAGRCLLRRRLLNPVSTWS